MIIAVIIPNMIGITMLIMLLINNTWKFSGKEAESRIIFWIISIVFLMCIVEPVSFWLDGKPGLLVRVALYFCNSLLFIADVLTGPMWICVLLYHMSAELSKKIMVIIHTVSGIEILLLIVNLFIPVVFDIDENNIYKRGPAFFWFMVILFAFLIHAVIIYISEKKKGDSIKFFPIWQFLIPLTIGTAIQSLFYGVSLVWPSGAVAISGALLGFQSEAVFRDELTGLYNRYYLDNLRKKMKRQGEKLFTLVMMDMNGFKSINDEFGHGEGDRALIMIGQLLDKSVGKLGKAIRYAGDEFILLINSYNNEEVESVLENIRDGLAEINESETQKYKLSLSMGVSEVDFSRQSFDEIMKQADERMYEDKKRYHGSQY